VWCCLCDPTFSRFSRTPICDRQSILYRFPDVNSYLSKVASADPPHLHLAPSMGWPRSNFAEIFGLRKLLSLSYRVVCLCDPTFSRFSRTPTCDRRTDGWTDRQTQGHGQYRRCIALHGKNWLPWQRPWSDRNRISQQPSTPVRLPILNLVTIGHILSEITGLQPIVRSSAIAKGPRNALCQLKTCKMSHKDKCSSNCILHMISPATREWPSRSLEMTRIDGPYDTSY